MSSAIRMKNVLPRFPSWRDGSEDGVGMAVLQCRADLQAWGMQGCLQPTLAASKRGLLAIIPPVNTALCKGRSEQDIPEGEE